MRVQVLLVDDVPEVRRLVRTALRFRGGFEVVGEAGDGAEAVRIAQAVHPDVVVLDLGLPDLAGKDVLRRLRQHSPSSRIVVFSGMETPDHEWIAQRVEGFVLKDADLDYLVQLLETLGHRPAHVAALSLPADLSCLTEARRFLERTLDAWQRTELINVGQLVITELVSNAIRHADSAPHIQLSLAGDLVRVEVHDGGDGTPDPRPPHQTAEHGRGMYLIDALSTAWGVEEVQTGKVVWAELMPPRAETGDLVMA